jgi:hypothetical protein
MALFVRDRRQPTGNRRSELRVIHTEATSHVARKTRLGMDFRRPDTGVRPAEPARTAAVTGFEKERR